MEYLAEAVVGLLAGLLGGLLGIGGSVLIIPALVFYLSHTPRGYDGSQQHLIQAAAMICNVFVVGPALVSHSRARALQLPTLRYLVPGALVGMAAGVYLSNTPFFARQRGAYLAMGLAVFLAWEGFTHLWEFINKSPNQEPLRQANYPSPAKTAGVGFAVGLIGGLLGIGGGTLNIPLQCRVLAIPLRSAIANSAATIVVVSACGALYKNMTLSFHGFSVGQSLQLALMIIPTAMVGSFVGGRLTHVLPRRVLQVILIWFFFGMAVLTYERALAGLRRARQDFRAQASSRVSLEQFHRCVPCPKLSYSQDLPEWEDCGGLPSSNDSSAGFSNTRTMGARGPNCRRASKSPMATLTAKLRLRAC
jgi:uncharacterized protein